VNSVRHQFLASAGFVGDQNAGVGVTCHNQVSGMRYAFGIVHDTREEIVLRESRNWDGVITGGVILVIMLTALGANVLTRKGWVTYLATGVSVVWCLWLVAIAAARTETTVRPDVVWIVWSIGSFSQKRVHPTNDVEEFRAITAPPLGGDGKGLSMVMVSGRRVKVTRWSRSKTLDNEVRRLNAFLSAHQRRSLRPVR
jgi:hypothetical protein